MDFTPSSDMSLVETMNSLSLHNSLLLHTQEYFEPIETYYDYDRTDRTDRTDTTISTHTYVTSQIDAHLGSHLGNHMNPINPMNPMNPMNPIINTNTSDTNNNLEDFQDFHDYDCYDNILPATDMNDEYDTSPYLCFGIPNKYCSSYFDDEDFIFNRYGLTDDIKKFIKVNNSIDEYTSNFCIGNGIVVDYNCSNDNPDIIYAKILYIYTYINYYYKDLKHFKPGDRIKYLPENLLYWVDNIITILKKVFNDESLKTHSFLSIEDVYFKELCYGLNVITTHVTLLLNHYKNYNLLLMEEKHIKPFFKIVNNMCVVVIFMKLNNI